MWKFYLILVVMVILLKFGCHGNQIKNDMFFKSINWLEIKIKTRSFGYLKNANLNMYTHMIIWCYQSYHAYYDLYFVKLRT